MSEPIENTPKDPAINVNKKKKRTSKKYLDWAGWAFFAFLLAASQVYLLDSQNDLVKEQVSIGKDQTAVMNAQINIDAKQTSLDSFQNELTKQQNILFENQNALVLKQNNLLDIQNERLTDQNQLMESQRRSSYVFLLGNIMDAVTNELSKPENHDRRLPPQIIGEVIALSNSLTPYQFMLNNTITEKALSPERGILLIFILNSDINKNDLDIILQKSTFGSAYMQSLTISGDTISKLDLSSMHIGHLDIYNSSINSFSCIHSTITTLFVSNSSFGSLEIIQNKEIDTAIFKNVVSHSLRIVIPNINLFNIIESNIQDSFIASKSIRNIGLARSRFEHFRILCNDIFDLGIYETTFLHGGVNPLNELSWLPISIGSTMIWAPDDYFRSVQTKQIDLLTIRNSRLFGCDINSTINQASIDGSILFSMCYIKEGDVYISSILLPENRELINSIVSSNVLTENQSYFVDKYGNKGTEYLVFTDSADSSQIKVMQDSVSKYKLYPCFEVR